MTEPSAAIPTPSGAVNYARRRTDLDRAVADKVRSLQRRSLLDEASAVRTLAVLRRAVGSAPGSAPDVWDDTVGLVPLDRVGQGDAPSAAERAAHSAVTLFALHRQGKSRVAHIDGVAPGQALARLSRKRGGESDSEGVRRRFDALLTASDPAEAAHHLRGLVLLLRSEEVGLDYGHLAEDLSGLWTPTRRDTVRLAWARQYRGLKSDDAPGEAPTTTSPTPTTPED